MWLVQVLQHPCPRYESKGQQYSCISDEEENEKYIKTRWWSIISIDHYRMTRLMVYHGCSFLSGFRFVLTAVFRDISHDAHKKRNLRVDVVWIFEFYLHHPPLSRLFVPWWAESWSSPWWRKKTLFLARTQILYTPWLSDTIFAVCYNGPEESIIYLYIYK